MENILIMQKNVRYNTAKMPKGTVLCDIQSNKFYNILEHGEMRRIRDNSEIKKIKIKINEKA